MCYSIRNIQLLLYHLSNNPPLSSPVSILNIWILLSIMSCMNSSGVVLHTTVVCTVVLVYFSYEFVAYHLCICLVSLAQTHVQSCRYKLLMYPVIFTCLFSVFEKNWCIRHLLFEIWDPSHPAQAVSLAIRKAVHNMTTFVKQIHS